MGYIEPHRSLAPIAAPLSSVIVKICGLSTPETLAAALDAGAHWVGLVFFPKSPRHVSLAQARALSTQARGRADVVALTVDADEAALDAVVEAVWPARLQLHGRETPEHTSMIARRYGLPVIKAVGVSVADDLAAAVAYRAVSDLILYDAKPSNRAVLPGGNGVTFDWTMLRGVKSPFMLSGGLTPENVAEALRVAKPAAVDVSSGVERASGIKDPARIAAFMKAVRGAGMSIARPPVIETCSAGKAREHGDVHGRSGGIRTHDP